MTVTTYAAAATQAFGAFAKAFPEIDFTVRPVQSERVVEIAWTDGPTAAQVKAALKPHLDDVEVRAYRRISEDFRALLVDDIETGADLGHDDEPMDARVVRYSQTIAVTAEREIKRVYA